MDVERRFIKESFDDELQIKPGYQSKGLSTRGAGRQQMMDIDGFGPNININLEWLGSWGVDPDDPLMDSEHIRNNFYYKFYMK